MSQESRIYRVNPFCPGCGEEHVYYDIETSEEEQKIVDDYYEQHKNETTWFLLLSPDMIPMGVTPIYARDCDQ